ncbi:MAG: glycosyltransferase [Janthinobacterium lividum]
MTRAAAQYRVVFWEEPLPAPDGAREAELRTRLISPNLLVATPLLPSELDPIEADAAQRTLLDGLLTELGQIPSVTWFYTPMALGFAGHLRSEVTVFDSMDELSAFSAASPRLLLLERRLMRAVDLVFTGGRSLYGAKQGRHHSVHLFPSSVDVAHFGRARVLDNDPLDQAGIARPRIGYFGVIDERMDLALLDAIARQRPDWQFVMVGPVTKIDPASLPGHANIHWLGLRQYQDLPLYLSGWDAGLMPFAMNEATRFISPTKTPEFLAAGVPVVSTPVIDVIRDWGRDGLVGIASDADATVAALERAMLRAREPWLAQVDQRLARISWDVSWKAMQDLIDGVRAGGVKTTLAGESSHV